MINFKVGILGAGNIADTIADTLNKLSGFEPYAVASRNLEKADQCKLKLELNKDKKVSNSVILDQDVYVAVRPEGFSVGRDGCLSVFVEQIETLGRDISIVGTHPNCVKPTFKAIVDADTPVTPGQMKLGIKKNKCFVFTKDTEERIL